MASTYLNILVDDDTGTPTEPNYDGTPLDSTFFAGIEAILNEFMTRPTKTVGGVWTWETAGLHSFSGAVTPTNRLLVRNTQSGSSNTASLAVGNNLADVVGELAVYAGDATISGASAPNRTVLAGHGTYGLAFIASHINGELSWFTNNTYVMNLRVSSSLRQLQLSPDPISSGSQFIIGNHPNNPGPAVVQSGSPGVTSESAMFGCNWHGTSTSASGRVNTTVGGGYLLLYTNGTIQFNSVSSAGVSTQLFNAQLVGSSHASFCVGGSSGGIPGNVELASGTGSPVSGQLLFGGDGSGWQLRIGRNDGGAILHLWKLTDSGELSPIADGIRNLGSTGAKMAHVYTVNLSATGVVQPLVDSTGGLGQASNRWASLYVLDANFGDASFDNGWSITEGEKVGLGEGLAFVNKENDLCMFIDDEGSLFVHETRPLRLLLDDYRRMSKKERLRGR
jgi:hypothetical protein